MEPVKKENLPKEEEEASSQVNSGLVVETIKPIIKPRHQNPSAVNSCLCLTCRAPLDYPYVFQQCQHVVCAQCAKDHSSPLCPSCVKVNNMNQSNIYITSSASVGFSRQVAELVQHVAGRGWVESARAKLERESNADFVHATVPRIQWKRVPSSNDDDQAASDGHNKSQNKKGKPRKDDYDEYDKDNEGCCMCLCRNFFCCPCECCCPKVRTNFCVKFEKVLEFLGKLILGFLFLVFLAWLINLLLTGNWDLTNVLGSDESWATKTPPDASSPLNTPIQPMTTTTTTSSPQPTIALQDLDPEVLEFIATRRQRLLRHDDSPTKSKKT